MLISTEEMEIFYVRGEAINELLPY